MAQMIVVGTKAVNLDHVKVVLPYNYMNKETNEIQFSIAVSLVEDKFEVLKKFDSQIDRDNELQFILNNLKA